VHERAAELNEDALVWERHGWKLALQYLIASCGEPRVSQAAAIEPRPPSAAAPLRPLPSARELPKLGIEATLQRRRTCREFSGAALELGTLATLLADATGSALRPEQLTIHLLVMRVTGLEPGVYRYQPDAHALAQLRSASTEQIEAQLVRTLIGQPYAIGSSVAVLLSAGLDARIAARPADSTLRACLIEIGMLAQRLLLCGHAFELDSFLSAAILEHEARALTMGDIDESMSPIHLVAFGGN
jgi:SagB-type dehydrogenase family enzyme